MENENNNTIDRLNQNIEKMLNLGHLNEINQQ